MEDATPWCRERGPWCGQTCLTWNPVAQTCNSRCSGARGRTGANANPAWDPERIHGWPRQLSGILSQSKKGKGVCGYRSVAERVLSMCKALASIPRVAKTKSQVNHKIQAVFSKQSNTGCPSSSPSCGICRVKFLNQRNSFRPSS